MMNIPASLKYPIIQEMTQRDNNVLNITWLCAASGVSRSGYYHYLDTETSGDNVKNRTKRIL